MVEGSIRDSADWKDARALWKQTLMASDLHFARLNGRTNDCLRCERCRGFDYDVGKIKEWPDLCLHCAVVLEDKFTESEAYKKAKAWHDTNPKSIALRSMPTTHNICGFEVVYMEEEVFKDFYKKELGVYSGEDGI